MERTPRLTDFRDAERLRARAAQFHGKPNELVRKLAKNRVYLTRRGWRIGFLKSARPILSRLNEKQRQDLYLASEKKQALVPLREEPVTLEGLETVSRCVQHVLDGSREDVAESEKVIERTQRIRERLGGRKGARRASEKDVLSAVLELEKMVDDYSPKRDFYKRLALNKLKGALETLKEKGVGGVPSTWLVLDAVARRAASRARVVTEKIIRRNEERWRLLQEYKTFEEGRNAAARNLWENLRQTLYNSRALRDESLISRAPHPAFGEGGFAETLAKIRRAMEGRMSLGFGANLNKTMASYGITVRQSARNLARRSSSPALAQIAGLVERAGEAFANLEAPAEKRKANALEILNEAEQRLGALKRRGFLTAEHEASMNASHKHLRLLLQGVPDTGEFKALVARTLKTLSSPNGGLDEAIKLADAAHAKSPWTRTAAK